jgi:hypothetical protein
LTSSAAQLLGRRQRRPFHRLGVRQQRAPHLGQFVALARAVEQGVAELVFEAVDAARHRGVLDLEPARRARQRAGARQFEEKTQVGPLGQAVHDRLFLIKMTHCALVHIPAARFWCSHLCVHKNHTSGLDSALHHMPPGGAYGCANLHTRWARCCLFNQSHPSHTAVHAKKKA